MERRRWPRRRRARASSSASSTPASGTSRSRSVRSPPASDNKAPKGWSGECDLGADGSGEPCNGKLIGARYYVDGFGEDNIADEEFLSPRDGDGHGSHTASTAAGNVVRNVNVDGTDFGTVSGMAPGAQIAAYKVCWTGNVPDTTDDDGCSNDDSVAAIEDAVLDGVDVINYSIGGTTESESSTPSRSRS